MDKQWQRFWKYVHVIPGGCWEWTGGKFSNGYALFGLSGSPRRNALGHRFAYEHLIGAIPEGKDLDHLCRIRHCVNPAHLEPVTRSENLLRSPLMGQANLRKQHCRYGHALTPDNVYLHKGHRHCRACRKRVEDSLRKDPSYMQKRRADDARYHREARARKARARLSHVSQEGMVRP